MAGTHPSPEPIEAWRAGEPEPGRLRLNGSAVAYQGQSILLLGPSGSGKSTLAIDLMALGGTLIADDGVDISIETAQICRPASSPDLIEARGMGLLHAGPTVSDAPLALVADLGRREPQRLPPRRMVAVGAHRVPLILAAGQTSLAAKLLHCLVRGRQDPDASAP